MRWHRCLRCDSWLPLPPPAEPAREQPPDRDEIELPLRGPAAARQDRAAADRDRPRASTSWCSALLAVAILLFAANQASLRDFYRVLADLQGGAAAADRPPTAASSHELDKLFSLSAARCT